MLHTHIVNYVVLLWYDRMVLTLWILNYEHILYIFIAISMLMFVLCFNIFNPFYEKTTSCQIISIINRNAFIMFEFIRSPLKSSRQQWWIIDDIWFTEDKTCFMILLNENRKKTTTLYSTFLPEFRIGQNYTVYLNISWFAFYSVRNHIFILKKGELPAFWKI